MVRNMINFYPYNKKKKLLVSTSDEQTKGITHTGLIHVHETFELENKFSKDTYF